MKEKHSVSALPCKKKNHLPILKCKSGIFTKNFEKSLILKTAKNHPNEIHLHIKPLKGGQPVFPHPHPYPPPSPRPQPQPTIPNPLPPVIPEPTPIPSPNPLPPIPSPEPIPKPEPSPIPDIPGPDPSRKK